MKASVKFIISIAVIVLSACSTMKKPQDTLVSSEKPVLTQPAVVPEDAQNPPMTLTKNGKTLNLVRFMDGAVCKNDLQGAKGVFLIYANPQDIERIKKEQGTQIFSRFETKIQNFSEAILQQAINTTNLSEDPFSLGDDVAKQKMVEQLTQNFRSAAIEPVNEFEKETSLTIEISAYRPSFEFFQKGCEATLNESENTSASYN